MPFLILVGTYATQIDFLGVPSFYGLAISLLGIVSYVVYLIRHRKNITDYWEWLKLELGKVGLGKQTYTPNQDQLPAATNAGGVAGATRRGGASAVGNGHANPIRTLYGEGSGSDHSENSSQGTFQEHGFEFHPPRLSDIPEYPEGGGLEGAGAGRGRGGALPGLARIRPLEPHLLHNDDESEMSDVSSALHVYTCIFCSITNH